MVENRDNFGDKPITTAVGVFSNEWDSLLRTDQMISEQIKYIPS